VKREKVMSFEKIFDICQDRIHAIFLFLSMLELVQMKYMTLMVGEGRNNFILEFNEHREEDPVFDMMTLGKEPPAADETPIGGLFGDEPVADRHTDDEPPTDEPAGDDEPSADETV